MKLWYAAMGVVVLPAMTTFAAGLGAADGYNAFIFGSVNGQNSDIAGSLAVGGSATFSSFTLGASIGSGDVVQTGGAFTLTNGTVDGNLKTNGSAALNGATVTGSVTAGGSITGSGTVDGAKTSNAATPVGINFAGTQSTLESYAANTLATLATQGSYNITYGNLNLTGSGGSMNVFDLTMAQLQSTNTVNFTGFAPGSTTIINVSGTGGTLPTYGFGQSFAGSQDLLMNFYQATSLTLNGSFTGSILAPAANVTFSDGALNGELIANSLSGGSGSLGQLNDDPFAGNLPVGSVPIPEPASVGLLGLAALGLLRRSRCRKH